MENNKKRKKMTKKAKIIAIALSVAAMGCLAFFVFSPSQEEEAIQYITYTVKTGNIETTVSGTGSISSAETSPYYSLAAGEGTQVVAQSGDKVESGDLIAVLTCGVTDARQLSSLADQMTENYMSLTKLYTSSSGVTKVLSPVKGRIKLLCVLEGDDAGLVQQQSALCVISSDGDMYAEFVPAEGTALTVNQKVKVEVDGKKITGKVVRTNSQGMAKVLITTDIYDQGTAVNIYDTEGNSIGTGSLMINAPVAVVATGGYVSSISVDENDRVSEGTTLMRLVQTGLDTGYAGVLAVISPADGILSDLAVAQGSALESGTLLFNILSACDYTLTVSVDELDIASVVVGQNATISIDALPDQTFTGTVQRVSSVGASSGGVATYNVVISLNDSTGILPGMSASADMQTAYKENVAIVPVDALITKGGKKYVMKASAVETTAAAETAATDTSNYIEVETGLTDGTNIEIISGLSSGEQIAYAQSTSDSSSDSGNFNMNGLDVGGDMPNSGGMTRPGGAGQ